MNHSIKIKIPANADIDKLYSSIESIFHQNHFKVERKEDYWAFERLTLKTPNKFQIISELLNGLSEGSITFDKDHPGVLICKMSYLKQLIVSVVIGLIVILVSSLYTGNYWMLFLRLGLPIMLILFVIGAFTGNSQAEDLLRKAIKQAVK